MGKKCIELKSKITSDFSIKFPHVNSFIVPFVFRTVGMGVTRGEHTQGK